MILNYLKKIFKKINQNKVDTSKVNQNKFDKSRVQQTQLQQSKIHTSKINKQIKIKNKYKSENIADKQSCNHVYTTSYNKSNENANTFACVSIAITLFATWIGAEDVCAMQQKAFSSGMFYIIAMGFGFFCKSLFMSFIFNNSSYEEIISICSIDNTLNRNDNAQGSIDNKQSLSEKVNCNVNLFFTNDDNQNNRKTSQMNVLNIRISDKYITVSDVMHKFFGKYARKLTGLSMLSYIFGRICCQIAIMKFTIETIVRVVAAYFNDTTLQLCMFVDNKISNNNVIPLIKSIKSNVYNIQHNSIYKQIHNNNIFNELINIDFHSLDYYSFVFWMIILIVIMYVILWGDKAIIKCNYFYTVLTLLCMPFYVIVNNFSILNPENIVSFVNFNEFFLMKYNFINQHYLTYLLLFLTTALPFPGPLTLNRMLLNKTNLQQTRSLIFAGFLLLLFYTVLIVCIIYCKEIFVFLFDMFQNIINGDFLWPFDSFKISVVHDSVGKDVSLLNKFNVNQLSQLNIINFYLILLFLGCIGIIATIISTLHSCLFVFIDTFANDFLRVRLNKAWSIVVLLFICYLSLITIEKFQFILDISFVFSNFWMPLIIPPLFFIFYRIKTSSLEFLCGICGSSGLIVLLQIMCDEKFISIFPSFIFHSLWVYYRGRKF